ncbi:MAG TPA: hypothetical protein VNG90_05490 [Candidatus Acidoferrum sp.]|nr:hypothetical protein [Candidatus Acidoferrum sp.]
MAGQQMQLHHIYVDEDGNETPILSSEELSEFDETYDEALRRLTAQLRSIGGFPNPPNAHALSFVDFFANYAAGKRFLNPARELYWALQRWSPGAQLGEVTKRKILRKIATAT